MNPTSEFKGGKAKKAGTSINGTSTDANAKGDKSTGKYHMLKRYIDLLWPQKKTFSLCNPLFGDPYGHRHRLHSVQ